MTFDELRERACAYLSLRLRPGLDPTQLVDECLASARQSLKDEFILRLSPEAWAQISLTYVTVFLDSERDVSVGEMFAAAIADSVRLNRLNMLAEQLAIRDPGPSKDGQDGHDLHAVKRGLAGQIGQIGGRVHPDGGGTHPGRGSADGDADSAHHERPKLTVVKSTEERDS